MTDPNVRPWQALLEARARLPDLSPEEQVGAFVVDVDRLKAVNDALGYRAGDQLLDELERRVRDWAGAGAYVVDLGLGTFGAIVPGLDGEPAAAAAAELLRVRLSQPVALDGGTVTRHVSVGYAHSRLQDASVAELVHRADDAFGQARRLPGDVAIGYTPQLHQDAMALAQIELHLRAAVSGGELVLHYQPEVDLRTGAILAVEALMRWQHPTLGLVGAAEFISVAERTGATRELGQWALRTACAQRAAWLAAYPEQRFVIRVNVSPPDLTDPAIIDQVTAVLAESGLPAELLCLEVTEVLAAPDPQAVVANLDRIRQLGALIALDDFGAGYSSLRRFKVMPIDVLKIDREFVADLPGNAVDPVIVSMLVGFTRIWQLDLVAEGVENRETVAALLELGCWRAQGRYLAAPAPAAQLEPLLATGRVDPALLTG
ncbi:GGDEF domain-containing phosphodiesterase [Jatrophihabitans cynanchi]|uniref:GGDEF domain-containing phosphodiesterase n=1 Tax=Jatrophihabitans cynanchi TaxID=2944128 RepID=A0ABY7K2L0_9ACTN|nr:GGDEF domain-containing phosphodiesterase [Jatrophihabitans sp. SB3-54]WAX59052.1 GGDEF domain-containing phosphodiesterase [Jatrophihabitans sp. SB3-54]